MAKGKDRTKKQTAAQDIPEQVATPAPETAALVAVVQPEEAATPASKKGSSSVKSPVAFTWAYCLNRCAEARANPEVPVPGRKSLVAGAINEGVAYYTARTQVQAFLKASNGGREVPKNLPRGLTLTKPEQVAG